MPLRRYEYKLRRLKRTKSLGLRPMIDSYRMPHVQYKVAYWYKKVENRTKKEQIP